MVYCIYHFNIIMMTLIYGFLESHDSLRRVQDNTSIIILFTAILYNNTDLNTDLTRNNK